MSTATKTRPTTKSVAKKPRAATKKAPPAAPPEPAKPATSGTVTLKAAQLKKIIAVVGPAASTDEGRPALTVMRVEVHADGSTEWLATDSYRLHHLWLPAHGNSIKSADNVVAVGLIPMAWLQRQLRAPFDKLAEITLTWGDRLVSMKLVDTADTATVGQHVDVNQWPNWRQLVASNPVAVATDDYSNFDPRLLAAVLATCTKWGSDVHSVCLDKLKPSYFVTKNSDGVFTGLLMPVRVP